MTPATEHAQCHFLSSTTAGPVAYHVSKLNPSRSYTTVLVTAIQDSKTVLLLTCSFQKPEVSSFSHQWPMPPDVPPPETLQSDADLYRDIAQCPDTHEGVRKVLLGMAEVCMSTLGATDFLQ